jgi:hypothetical protein
MEADDNFRTAAAMLSLIANRPRGACRQVIENPARYLKAAMWA